MSDNLGRIQIDITETEAATTTAVSSGFDGADGGKDGAGPPRS